ncbi:MAG: hypothetical protein ABEJ27_06470 [Halodesulfurarchaeum sp.]
MVEKRDPDAVDGEKGQGEGNDGDEPERDSGENEQSQRDDGPEPGRVNGSNGTEGAIHDSPTEADEMARSFTFRLPPIRFPSLVPGDLELHLPVPGYRREWTGTVQWIVLVALVFDAFDAALALTVGGTGPVGLARVTGGLLLAVIIAGRPGASYLWEGLPLLIGVPWIGGMPTLTALAVYRLRYVG